MSTFKTFAVAGAGNIGQYIVEELLKFKGTIASLNVKVLTRNANGAGIDSLSKKGAEIVVVDYSSPASLVSALSGTEVVVSTLAHGGPLAEQQTALAEAAKKAGVKLFAPSEFGNPTEGVTSGLLGGKNAFHRTLEKIGLPYVLYYTGPFGDWVLNPFFGWDLPNGKVIVNGEGNAPISFTTRWDIGKFVAYTLTHLPPQQLEWKELRVEGDRKTFNEILEEYQARSGKTVQISHRSRAELQAALKQNPHDIAAYLSLEWDSGTSIVGTSDNSLVPDFHPTKVVDALLQKA